MWHHTGHGIITGQENMIQGVIDRDRLFCLLRELISHAEEETSAPKGFQKTAPTNCPSIPTLHKGLDKLCY